MKELSVGEQRYQAVMAVLSGGRTVTEVARDGDVSRQTVHAWLARYEREGMEGMGARSHRPTRCPLQMPALIDRLSDGRGSECVWPAACRSRGRSPTRRATATPRIADGHDRTAPESD